MFLHFDFFHDGVKRQSDVEDRRLIRAQQNRSSKRLEPLLVHTEGIVVLGQVREFVTTFGIRDGGDRWLRIPTAPFMSGTAMFIEGERAVRSDVLSEGAQELDSVVSRYLPMFHKRAFRFLGNVPDAEDAVQNALLSAYKHLGQFRGQAQLSTWLTTIVTNAARMQLRRRRDSYLSLDEEQGEDGLTFSERLPDSKPSPEEVCSTAEARDQLVEGVRQLSPKLRRTLQLRDIDGLTTKEAALVLGVPQGTVKAQLARARAKLAGIIRVKHIKRRSRTVSLSKRVRTKGPSENWVWDEAGEKFGTSSPPEEVKTSSSH